MLDVSQFQNPNMMYRPHPVWYINDERAERDRAQIIAMRKAGMGGFVLSCRGEMRGMLHEEAGMDRLIAILDVAAEQHMRVWLSLDLFIGREEGSAQAIVSRPVMLDPEAPILPEKEGTLLGLIGMNVDKPVSFSVDSDRMAHIDHRQIVYMLTHVRFGRVNTLDPLSFARVIEPALNAARERLRRYFQYTVRGLFLGSVGLPAPPDMQEDECFVSWSPGIESALSAKDITIEKALCALFLPMEDDPTRQLRQTFWQLVSDEAQKNFYDPLAKWCGDNSLATCGTLDFDELMYEHIPKQANPARCLMNMGMPAVDHLPEIQKMETDRRFADVVRMEGRFAHIGLTASCALEENRRAAAILHSQDGWSQTPREVRGMADALLMRGISFFMPHAAFSSTRAHRKWDMPPDILTQPHFATYKCLADYLARMGFLLSQGVSGASVAVLYPRGPLAAQQVYPEETENSKEIRMVFEGICALLDRMHFEYRVVDSMQLQKAHTKDNAIYLDGVLLRALILPTAQDWDTFTNNFVRDWAGKGGRVLCFSRDAAPISIQRFGRGEWRTASHGQMDSLPALEEMGTKLNDFLAPQKQITIVGDHAERIRVAARKVGGDTIWYLLNTAPGAARVHVHFVTDANQVIHYDADSGKAQAVEATIDGDTLVLPMQLPSGSTAVFGLDHLIEEDEESGPFLPIEIGSEEDEEEKEAQEQKQKMDEADDDAPRTGQRQVLLPLEGWEFYTTTGNIHPLSSWHLRIEEEPAHIRHVYTTRIYSSTQEGEVETWRDTLRFTLQDDILMRSAALRVNGESTDSDENGFIFGACLRSGENTLELTIDGRTDGHRPRMLLERALIIGDFRLAERDENIVILPPSRTVRLSSFKELGYPFFSGCGVFERDFQLHKLPKKASLRLHSVTCAMQVYVNGKFCGMREWRPWEVDVTSALLPGRNTLRICVYNTRTNELELKTDNSGIDGGAYFRMEDF